MGGESSETSQGCEAGYEIQMSSSGDTTSVEADPYVRRPKRSMQEQQIWA